MLAATTQLISELAALAGRLSSLQPATGAEPRVLDTCQAVRATAQELQRWLGGRRQAAPRHVCDSVSALLAAAHQLVTAANQARFDSGDAAAAGRLTSAVRPLTEAMTAVLTWWDDLTSAQVTVAQQQAAAALADIGQVTSLQDLQPAVKVAVSELRRFVEVCQRLGGELGCERSRRLLAAQLRHLQLCAQLLPAAAVCRCVHPLNNNAKLPLSVAVRGVTESAAEAVALLSAPDAARRPAEQAEDGGFVRSTDGLLQLLQRCPQEGFAVQVQRLLEDFLAHALAVSQCAEGEDGQRITRACQQALEQFSAAAALQKVGPERRGEFVLACQLMADQLELAEHLVNSALLQLIVEVFTEPTRELDALLRVALQSGAAASGGDRAELDAAVADHDLAADKVFQVCALATACSTDDNKLCLIRAGLLLLETLEPEVYPAAALVHSLPSDPAAGQHLATLRDRWRQTLMDVRDCLDQIMDPLAFCKAVEASLAVLAAQMKELLYDQETAPVLRLAGRLLSTGRRLGQFVLDQVTGSSQVTEAVLLVNKAVGQLPGCMRAVQERPADLGAHRLLQKVVQVVVTYVRRLRVDLEKRDEDESGVLDCLDDLSRKEAGEAASVTLLSDVGQVPLDETRPLCSRVGSRLAASSRTFNSDRSRTGAAAATELTLDISKYLSYNSQSHRTGSLRLRAVRVDLTPLVPRTQPVTAGEETVRPLSPLHLPAADLVEPEPEMLPLDPDEVAAELSSLSLLIDAQPAADLSHILDSLTELAAELSQDVRETEESLRRAPAAYRRQRPPPPPSGVHGWPAYVTAGAEADTCPTPSCGGRALTPAGESAAGQTSGAVPAGVSAAGQTSGAVPSGVSAAGQTSGAVPSGVSAAGKTSGAAPAGVSAAGQASGAAPAGVSAAGQTSGAAPAGGGYREMALEGCTSPSPAAVGDGSGTVSDGGAVTETPGPAAEHSSSDC